MSKRIMQGNASPLSDPMHPIWNDSSDEDTGIFGLPFSEDDASLVIVPVPWDAACSQGTGTAKAPELILKYSRYVELHDLVLGNIYERGIAMTATLAEFASLSKKADAYLENAQEPGQMLDQLSQQVNQLVKTEITGYIEQGKTVGMLGGDHSVSLGSIAAHHHAYPEIGILQIDAHADLRPSLDGMTSSHASVMYHVMESLQPVSLTQVGVRGICNVEKVYQDSDDRISMFTDFEIQALLAAGQDWFSVCDRIIDTLPTDIYLTFDIDGLDPAYCPHTGTPVPGGMSFTQVCLLLHRIVKSGRKLRGFDLVEVGGEAQDALIAAHLLYLLCGLVS